MEIPQVHIIRHGQSLHNIDRGYPHHDPPLTETGHATTTQLSLPIVPDLIITSPMTRTIQTAINIFPSVLLSSTPTPSTPELQIWPDLREAHDAICNKGISRQAISAKFPQLDFSACQEEWDYPAHTIEGATKRAEAVRKRLKEMLRVYRNVVLVSHRGFIAYLVKGERFDFCEMRRYRFANDDEVAGKDELRFGVNGDTGERQDFGPTVLVPCGAGRGGDEGGEVVLDI